ncbi:PP2C family protein-serine/threonine phosphatase [Actinoallomurus soli]|uniref:PP2C family protein-serine/threonine phosphatase n=1 Tax=Actinoallomurus soli TaxID=2952535 RepID=UPI00209284FF|nr:PP2C family protein-serine/threonine phosphatase [Actinoallomurus soli]MCO5974965.1 serine/threonine-protein phosphatase [Actinoallomurus soli]
MKRIRIDPVVMLRGMPTLMIAGGAAADLLGPQPYVGLPFLAAAPLVAGVLLPWRSSATTAAVAGVVSVGVDLLLRRAMTAVLVDLAIVLLVGVIGLWTKWLMDRQTHNLAVVRDIAEAAQRAVLPDPPTALGPLQIAARYEAAQAGARVGGDLYAVRATRFGIRVIIGDVRGKGLKAVSTVCLVIGAFRHEAEEAATLPELADRLNATLARERCPELVDHLEEGFVTALLVEIPPDATKMSLLSLGHTPPYLLHAGRVATLEPSAPDLPLGMDLPTANGAAQPDTIDWPPGATLLLVTDGITEARDQHGTFYDPSLGLAHARHSSPHELVNALAHNVTRWTGRQCQDDMAILALARNET